MRKDKHKHLPSALNHLCGSSCLSVLRSTFCHDDRQKDRLGKWKQYELLPLWQQWLIGITKHMPPTRQRATRQVSPETLIKDVSILFHRIKKIKKYWANTELGLNQQINSVVFIHWKHLHAPAYEPFSSMAFWLSWFQCKHTHTARDNTEDTEVVLSCLHTDMRESQEPYSWFEKCLLYASRSNSQS